MRRLSGSMLWHLVASGDLNDTFKELLKIQRKEAMEKRLRELRRSVMLICDSCGNYFEFDTSIHDVDNAFVINVESTFGMIQ